MQAARLITMGGILGVGAALVLNKPLASMLVGVTSHDAVSFSLAWALMTLVALLASTIPAAQAARTDLVSVLLFRVDCTGFSPAGCASPQSRR
jgi:predicted lysophospholipase L1 biosynthesis ABC-type transport system permease subunit